MAQITKFKMLGIIPCSKAKIWDMLPTIGEVFAENAYTNPFHNLARTYVSLFTDDLIIFSAKYGFLSSKDTIPETYDVTFDRPNDPHISVEELKIQIRDKNLDNYEKIMAICNDRYISMLHAAFQGKVEIIVPFKKIEDDLEGCLLLNKQLQQLNLIK